MSKQLVFLAGQKAFQLIKQNGLTPEMVKAIAGAAGGPKWLVLNRLDQFIFTEWMQNRTDPLFLIGSSIGAWRFSAMCRKNPLEAQAQFEQGYIHQQYSGKPTTQEVSEESRKIIEAFVSDDGIDEILNHPYLKIGFMTSRCKGLTESNITPLLALGFTGTVLLNLINRNLLGLQMERVLFKQPGSDPPYLKSSCIPMSYVDLSVDNYRDALLASGSIPFLMDPVRDIKGAPTGTYRDGGLIDYHLDIPYNLKDDQVVLYPHFSEKVVPGWLDKSLKWRKPSQLNMQNVLLVAPSKHYVDRLPNNKIPDRKDFWLYKDNDKQRFKDWKSVVESGRILAEELNEVISSGKIKQLVKPL